MFGLENFMYSVVDAVAGFPIAMERAYGFWGLSGAFLLDATVATAVLLGAGQLAYTYVERKYARRRHDLLTRLDATRTFAFASQEACQRRGFSPEQSARSYAAALKNERRTDARPEYRNVHTCIERHGLEFVTRGHSSLYLMPVGDVSIPMTTDDPNSYVPKTVGWQAAANDLTLAIPLYATPKPGIGMRSDGKLLRLAL